MSRNLAVYGLDPPYGSFTLQDPALFESLTIRMMEDLELAVQVSARADRFGLVNSGIVVNSELVGRALQVLGVDEVVSRTKVPDQVRGWAEAVARDYARGPLPYGVGALEGIGNAVAAATYSFLLTGAENASQEGTQVVMLRHILPACESWPYPLNRFC